MHKGINEGRKESEDKRNEGWCNEGEKSKWKEGWTDGQMNVIKL